MTAPEPFHAATPGAEAAMPGSEAATPGVEAATSGVEPATPGGVGAGEARTAIPGEVGEPVAAGSGPTGHAGVDAALAALAATADLTPGEQVAAYEAAHRTLSQTLATIDQG